MGWPFNFLKRQFTWLKPTNVYWIPFPVEVVVAVVAVVAVTDKVVGTIDQADAVATTIKVDVVATTIKVDVVATTIREDVVVTTIKVDVVVVDEAAVVEEAAVDPQDTDSRITKKIRCRA